MNNTQLMEKVMERLKNQFLEPATFTLKEHPTEERFSEVNVFVHGFGTFFGSSMDFLFEQAANATEDIRKINSIADYLITFFIEELQIEKEENAIMEVVMNLDYLYKISVKTHHLDVENHDGTSSREVAFIFEKAKETFMVLMDSAQMKREYEGRFESVDAPDILVDLKEIFARLTTGSYESAIAYVEELERGIIILNNDYSQDLKNELENQYFLSSIDIEY